MGQPVLPGSLGKIYFVFKSMKSKKVQQRWDKINP